MLAGRPSAGKSFLTLACVKKFLDDNTTGKCIYFDTEFALEKAMLGKRGIDLSRFHIIQTETLQDFRTQSIKFLDAYEKSGSKTPVLLCLDSLSNLPTQKEVTDALTGNEARDMTKAQIIRSIFRILTGKLGKNNIPLIIASHVYSSMDMYSPVVISGGDGALYAASTVITLNKSKDKDGTDVVGNIIKATTYKSRYTKENQSILMQLDFKDGLNRYHGLLDLAEKYDIIKRVTAQSYELLDGTKVKGKDIRENPESFFTKDVLDQIDKVAYIEYSLGIDTDTENTKEEE
jgi:RecA/RadA recombinase